ncbi:MAG: hypothetical protein ACRYFS_14965 [Janthinobacterium lividum]
MSEILARIRVRETAGIRRFLYPLRVELNLENKLWAQIPELRLLSSTGQPIPTQVSDRPTRRDPKMRFLDFALSMEPFADEYFTLQLSNLNALIEDPLRISAQPKWGLLESQQQRFSVLLDVYAFPGEIVYDNIKHLRRTQDKGSILCNRENADLRFYDPITKSGGGIFHSGSKAWLNGFYRLPLVYPDGRNAWTQTTITACKSWVMVRHIIEEAKPNDEIVFTLPLAITSPTLTCDFGVGGYVFGKLDGKATEIVWCTEFGDAPYARWTVATAGRVDYVGEVETAEAFLPQRWFHLIDSDKALAVAITKLPKHCQSMTVRLTLEGDVSIVFKMGEIVTGAADFGVCYHFLNDVPAIAAATNPQSILLPPVVEVLEPLPPCFAGSLPC